MRLIGMLSLVVAVVGAGLPQRAQSASPPSVPREFIGEWDTRLADCAAAGTKDWLRVNRNSVDLYDAPGVRVVGVERHGKHDVVLRLAVTRDGRNLVEARRLRLANAGLSMVDYVDKRTRQRCPAL